MDNSEEGTAEVSVGTAQGLVCRDLAAVRMGTVGHKELVDHTVVDHKELVDHIVVDHMAPEMLAVHKAVDHMVPVAVIAVHTAAVALAGLRRHLAG